MQIGKSIQGSGDLIGQSPLSPICLKMSQKPAMLIPLASPIDAGGQAAAFAVLTEAIN